jgi:hypothetical protein
MASAPRASVRPASPNVHMPADNAARVVEDARNLSPNLGDRMLTAHLAGRPVIIRELLPQDLKLDIETLPQAEAVGGWPLTRFDHWQGPRAPAGRGRARGVGGGDAPPSIPSLGRPCLAERARRLIILASAAYLKRARRPSPRIPRRA